MENLREFPIDVAKLLKFTTVIEGLKEGQNYDPEIERIRSRAYIGRELARRDLQERLLKEEGIA